jgi:hypothetical protein
MKNERSQTHEEYKKSPQERGLIFSKQKRELF